MSRNKEKKKVSRRGECCNRRVLTQLTQDDKSNDDCALETAMTECVVRWVKENIELLRGCWYRDATSDNKSGWQCVCMSRFDGWFARESRWTICIIAFSNMEVCYNEFKVTNFIPNYGDTCNYYHWQVSYNKIIYCTTNAHFCTKCSNEYNTHYEIF